jgi:hypothetical protein
LAESKISKKKKARRQLFPKESESFFEKEAKELDQGKKYK